MGVLTARQSGNTALPMPTVTVKMPKDLHARLEAEAARRRTSKSAVLRDSFIRGSSAPAPAKSFYERAKKYIGSVSGPGDLSARSKTLEGYGHSRRPR